MMLMSGRIVKSAWGYKRALSAVSGSLKSHKNRSQPSNTSTNFKPQQLRSCSSTFHRHYPSIPQDPTSNPNGKMVTGPLVEMLSRNRLVDDSVLKVINTHAS